jgi:NADPH2:quinone reductase
MKAVQATRTGGPEVLEVVDVPEPRPGPGEVRVRVEAAGLNFIDVYIRTGLYPAKLPSTLGFEGAGVVDAVGEGVTRARPGDRVAYASGPLGAYAEAHCVKADTVVRLPDEMDARTAAAIMLKGMTAEALIRRCRPVAAGETILVHAAVGGVGLLLCQWARRWGPR